MDPQLKAQLRQRIYVATLVSRDAAGDPTYGAPALVMCRCEDDQEESDSTAGEELVTRKRIVTESAIHKTDRIWLPGDDRTDATLGRTPMKVQELPAENGTIDHYETIV
jgi:hypothetical protein